MKRLIILIVLVMVVSWLITSHRSPFRRSGGPSRHWVIDRHGREGDSVHRRIAVDTRRKTQHALAEASEEVRQALAEASDDVREALDEARDELHRAFDDVRTASVSDHDRFRAFTARSRRFLPRLKWKRRAFPYRSCRELA